MQISKYVGALLILTVFSYIHFHKVSNALFEKGIQTPLYLWFPESFRFSNFWILYVVRHAKRSECQCLFI